MDVPGGRRRRSGSSERSKAAGSVGRHADDRRADDPERPQPAALRDAKGIMASAAKEKEIRKVAPPSPPGGAIRREKEDRFSI